MISSYPAILALTYHAKLSGPNVVRQAPPSHRPQADIVQGKDSSRDRGEFRTRTRNGSEVCNTRCVYAHRRSPDVEEGRTSQGGHNRKDSLLTRHFHHQTGRPMHVTFVGEFANRAKGRVSKLDVASLNAGIGQHKYEKSPDGVEMSLQVNVLSTALMALLLLPKLRETASAAATKNDEPAPHMPFLLSIQNAKHRLT